MESVPPASLRLGDRPFYDSMSAGGGQEAGGPSPGFPALPPSMPVFSVLREKMDPKMAICMSAPKLEEKLPACALSRAALTGRSAGFRLCSLQRRAVIGDP